MIMNKLALTLTVAGAATLGLVTAADAGGRSQADYKAWRETMTSVRAAKTQPAPVIEGRNVTIVRPAPQGVETYIARQIEQDRRGAGR